MVARGTVKWFGVDAPKTYFDTPHVTDTPPLLQLAADIKAGWVIDAEKRKADEAAEAERIECGEEPKPIDPTTEKINRLAIQSAVECAS